MVHRVVPRLQLVIVVLMGAGGSAIQIVEHMEPWSRERQVNVCVAEACVVRAMEAE